MLPVSSIKYIGADDDNLDLFEAQYPVPHGISYNSYLIDDEHIAIVDAVDARRRSDWLANIRYQVEKLGRTPEYVIVQHAEPDHTGSLAALIAEYPAIKVVCTAKAAGMLEMFYEEVDWKGRTHPVGDNETLSLGRTLLRFITAPMVHWPEVMMTLDETDHVLFSADAFGTFAQWGDTGTWEDEARRYYTNIVGRYGPSVQFVMKKLRSCTFHTILPLHGPAITSNLSRHWRLYDTWSQYQPETDGTLVAYASIYGGTAEAARFVAAAMRPYGEVETFDLCRHDVSYAVAQAFRLSRMVLACSTYDSGLFPAMSSFLHHIADKHLGDRTVALIQNGAWAPVAAKLMAAELAKMRNMTVVEPILTLRGRLHKADLPTIQTLAATLGAARL